MVIRRLGGAESDEGLEIFGRPEGFLFAALGQKWSHLEMYGYVSFPLAVADRKVHNLLKWSGW